MSRGRNRGAIISINSGNNVRDSDCDELGRIEDAAAETTFDNACDAGLRAGGFPGASDKLLCFAATEEVREHGGQNICTKHKVSNKRKKRTVERSLASAGRLWSTLFVALIVACGFTGVAIGQESRDTQSTDSSTAISTNSDAASDNAIQQRIEAIFAQVDALQNVAVNVDEGVVVLSGTASNENQASQAVELAARLVGVVTVQDEIERTLDIEDNLEPIVDGLRATLKQWLRALPLFVLSSLVFLAVVFAGLKIASWSALWRRIAPNPFLADLLAQTMRVLAVALGLVIALNLLGAGTFVGTILGGAGVIGIAIGFAIRDTLENYIASIMLSIRQPFRASDHVLIDEHEGKVARLTSRATILLTLDGNHLRIPNSTVFKAVILNYSRNPERRFAFSLGVDAEDDPISAIDTGVEAIKELHFVLPEPAPSGHVASVGDSNILLEFQAWINQRQTDYHKGRSLAIRTAKRALEDSGFTLPEPIYRLRFDGGTDAGHAIASKSGPAGEALAEPLNRGGRKNRSASRGAADHPVVDIRPEQHLDLRVREERATDPEEDLLDEERPVE